MSHGRPASVLILGSGPVVIGQAAEFDYAGTQACRALRAEGVRTILVNSNPATIMTDPQVADVVYLEPLTVEAVEAVISRERPDGILAGLGGQTALNLATALAELDGRAAVVISNPPYVPADEIPIDPEVHRHDPEAALYGGPDGLDVVRVLSTRAAELLHPGGLLVIEHAETQSAPIAAILAADGWRAIAHHRDLTLRDRAMTAVR